VTDPRLDRIADYLILLAMGAITAGLLSGIALLWLSVLGVLS
jgi:hypothetical protein